MIPTLDDILVGNYKPYKLTAGTIWGRDNSIRYEVALYHQPRLNYYISKAYHRWERLSWRFLRYLDKPARKWHARRCKDDCTTVFDFGAQGWDKMCGRIPLTNRQDLRCYDLSRKNRREIVSYEVSEYQYKQIRKVDDPA